LVLAFNYLRTAEGKTFKLLWLRENVVCIQISGEPYKNNDSKQNKARTVFHCRKKGKQKNPEDNIISYPNQDERVSVPLFD